MSPLVKSYKQQNLSKKQLYLKRTFLLFMGLIVVGYSTVAITAPYPKTVYTQKNITISTGEVPKIIWPDAGQFALGSVEEGNIQRSAQDETPIPTASVAKVITALAVMQKMPIIPNSAPKYLTISQNDVDIYNYYASVGGSRAYVTLGQSISEQDAITAMLLPSANNLADTLAIWAFGSMADYKTYTQNLLIKWGLTKTLIGSDASGFSPDTVSTASELILLGQKLMKNDILRSIVKLKSAQIPITGEVRNTNILLTDENVVGIKTGHTDVAGGCLLYAKTYNINTEHAVTILASALGTPSINQAFNQLDSVVESAKTGFKERILARSGDTVGVMSTPWGSSSSLILRNNITYYGWGTTPLAFKSNINTESRIPKKGEELGTLRLLKGDAVVAESILINNATINTPNLFWRLSHPVR